MHCFLRVVLSATHPRRAETARFRDGRNRVQEQPIAVTEQPLPPPVLIHVNVARSAATYSLD